MFDFSVAGLLHWAGSFWLTQALAIIIGTFILEDAATVLAAIAAQQGGLAVGIALGALYAGVMLGDAGLYGLGRVAHVSGLARRLIPSEQRMRARAWIKERTVKVVFVSRFIPGARLPTYTACGYFGASFLRFGLTVVAATLIWTTTLFLVAMRVGHVLMDHLGAWRWAGLAGFVIVVVVMGRIIARWQGASK